ncbi:sodium:solute symporter family protein [Halegenticoccus tardaugens]|uniref:sodium:solute symporter family protein n=1 Tax=Halegenticoccus tardaugens TaxID=2071624 RepID=UPI00100A431F|nr:sodium:solute symporter family protein [Halegenticoccus tardaugens]
MAKSLLSTEGIIVLVYLVGIFLIGIWGARKTKNFRDYFSTSNQLGMIVLAGTVLATQWGGVTLLGIAGYAYQHLWMGVWYSLGAVVRFLFWALLMGLVLRKVNAFSISEWFGIRFDNKNALVMTVLNLVVSIGLLGAQFVAFGSIITVFFDVPLTESIVLGAIAVVVYTIIGGMWGVAYTDVVQIAVSGAAAVGMVIYLRFTEGGFSTLRTSAAFPDGYFNAMEIAALGDFTAGWFFFFTIIGLWTADMFLNHNMQRMVSARNLRVAYWAPIFGGMSYMLIAYISPAVGAYARVVLGTGLENPDFAFPMLAQELLPAWAAGFVAAALLAVVMSSGDSYLLGPSTLAANDLYRAYRPNASDEHILKVARFITLIYGSVALLSALFFQTIIGLILTFLTIGWAIIPALWASVAWRRATPNAVFASMVLGGGVNALLMLSPPAVFSGMPPYYVGWIGFLLAIVILLVGSILEGKSAVPENVLKRTVTDGGVTKEEDLEVRAKSAMEKIHY